MESKDMETVSGDYSGQKFGWRRKRDEAVILGGDSGGDFILQWEEFEYVCGVEGLDIRWKVNNKDTSERGLLKWGMVLLSEVKSKREREISYDIAYMWNLKKSIQMNLSTKQKQSYRCRKQTYGYQGV